MVRYEKKLKMCKNYHKFRWTKGSQNAIINYVCKKNLEREKV